MGTSDQIALGALLISLLALSISLFELLSNRPKLRVTLASALLSPESAGLKFTKKPRKFKPHEKSAESIDLVAVEVTNYGRQPIMIKTIELQMPHSNNSVCPEPISPGKERGFSLPAEFRPGQFGTFYFDASVNVLFDRATEPIPLRDFAFLKDIEIAIRHSWKKKPQIFRGLLRQ